MIWGLLYNKILACVLLLVIFALRHKRGLLASRALIVTASVYTWVAFACLWELLSRSSTGRATPRDDKEHNEEPLDNQ